MYSSNASTRGSRRIGCANGASKPQFRDVHRRRHAWAWPSARFLDFLLNSTKILPLFAEYVHAALTLVESLPPLVVTDLDMYNALQ